jgi:hypothetical protein
MKFLMTMFQIQDYGGIINHAEYLAKGLQELGHEVDFCLLVPKTKIVERRQPPKDIEQYRKVRVAGLIYPRCLTSAARHGTTSRSGAVSMTQCSGISLCLRSARTTLA